MAKINIISAFKKKAITITSGVDSQTYNGILYNNFKDWIDYAKPKFGDVSIVYGSDNIVSVNGTALYRNGAQVLKTEAFSTQETKIFTVGLPQTTFTVTDVITGISNTFSSYSTTVGGWLAENPTFNFGTGNAAAITKYTDSIIYFKNASTGNTTKINATTATALHSGDALGTTNYTINFGIKNAQTATVTSYKVDGYVGSSWTNWVNTEHPVYGSEAITISGATVLAKRGGALYSEPLPIKDDNGSEITATHAIINNMTYIAPKKFIIYSEVDGQEHQFNASGKTFAEWVQIDQPLIGIEEEDIYQIQYDPVQDIIFYEDNNTETLAVKNINGTDFVGGDVIIQEWDGNTSDYYSFDYYSVPEVTFYIHDTEQEPEAYEEITTTCSTFGEYYEKHGSITVGVEELNYDEEMNCYYYEGELRRSLSFDDNYIGANDAIEDEGDYKIIDDER